MKTPSGAEKGTRYGHFVVDCVLTYGRKSRVRFKCDCGNYHDALLYAVKSSASKGVLLGCKQCQSKAKSELGMHKFDTSAYLKKRFGRLIVTGIDVDPSRKNVKSRLVCMCDCGGQVVVRPAHLTTGKTKSCGCLHTQIVAQVCRELSLVHGNTSDGELNGHTPLYRAWMKIKSCCKAGKDKGIGLVNHEFDPRWSDFDEFYKDFGPIGRYQTISRIDQGLPWSKDNCFVNIGRRHLFESTE